MGRDFQVRIISPFRASPRLAGRYKEGFSQWGERNCQGKVGTGLHKTGYTESPVQVQNQRSCEKPKENPAGWKGESPGPGDHEWLSVPSGSPGSSPMTAPRSPAWARAVGGCSHISSPGQVTSRQAALCVKLRRLGRLASSSPGISIDPTLQKRSSLRPMSATFQTRSHWTRVLSTLITSLF